MGSIISLITRIPIKHLVAARNGDGKISQDELKMVLGDEQVGIRSFLDDSWI